MKRLSVSVYLIGVVSMVLTLLSCISVSSYESQPSESKPSHIVSTNQSSSSTSTNLPPEAGIIYPPSDECLGEIPLVIRGTAEDDWGIVNVNLLVDGSSVSVMGTTNWSASVTGLSEGLHTLSLQVHDSQPLSSQLQQQTFEFKEVGWRATPTIGAPPGRHWHAAVWDDLNHRMIVWGGFTNNGYTDPSGGIYDPVTDSWTLTSTNGAPVGRAGPTAVWNTINSTMIVWGGFLPSMGNFNSGGIYDPITDSWQLTSLVNAPQARSDHTAVFDPAGNRMIVWGGNMANYPPSGGVFDCDNNSWTATSQINAPQGRLEHTAVWDTQANTMIVWGGVNYSIPYGIAFNDGGIYNPDLDIWTTTSTESAPSPMYRHKAAWDENNAQMIIKSPGSGGGLYHPETDSWESMSTIDEPILGDRFSAIWDQDISRMIVWGGYVTITGGIYDANTDSWIPTSLTDAPSARAYNSAVWDPINQQMIIWGGTSGSTDNSTGARYRYCW